MRAPNDSLTDIERGILAEIEQAGVHVVHVEGGGDAPAYSYSIGLWHSFGQAEVMVFGLPAEVAEDLIQAIADEADEGKHFVADSKHTGLVEDYAVRFFAVGKAFYGEYLREALWAYEDEEFPAVQLVWPDKQGRWPWEDAAREGFRKSQPVLARMEPRA